VLRGRHGLATSPLVKCCAGLGTNLVLSFIPVREAQVVVLNREVEIWENELVLHKGSINLDTAVRTLAQNDAEASQRESNPQNLPHLDHGPNDPAQHIDVLAVKGLK
jgi:hypothetical protein